jgi:hypothetical protein
LVDFGIAKLMDNMGLTGSGLAVGTPTHMSPEQWRGDEVTAATDQYALSVVVYELISGRLPFDSSTAYALMNKHLNEPPTPLHTVRPDLPLELDNVLAQAMEKEPQFRFSTVTAFAEAFDKAILSTEERSTQFFTFEVRPLKLKADGELPSAFAAQMGGRMVKENTPNYSAAQPKAKNQSLPLDSPELRQLRKRVEQRINKRRELYMHAAVFVLIIPMLWLIWAIVGGGFPWPLIAMLGWGAGLGAHAMEVYFESERGDRMRAEEYRRELDRRGIDIDVSTVMYAEKPKNENWDQIKDDVKEEIASAVEEFKQSRRHRNRH